LVGGSRPNLWKQMRAASSGKSVIVASCARQLGSLLVSSGNRGTPVLHLLLITPPRHCSPSLRRVSYPAQQLSVNAWCTTFVSAVKDTHQAISRSISFVVHRCSHTYTIKATWKNIKIHHRPYWENEVKCVINKFKGSLTSRFNDVPELIVKRCF
jgi:hypothetical protein